MINNREAAVYRYLLKARGLAVLPSYRAIGEAAGGLSTSQVHRILHSLAEEGYLARHKRKGKRPVWAITDKRPPGFADEGEAVWWCVETNNLKSPGMRVFQPLTICFGRRMAPPLALELLADPRREARWARVRVKIEEVTDAE